MEAFGKYEVVEKIGEGGFGTVYLGQDPHLKRRVAIKTCDVATRDEDRKRFFREAEISAKLQHPNITTIYEFGFEGDLPFFVQEYLTGEDLSSLIGSKTNISLSQRLEILLDIAGALGYAHDQGVVHRDVKPANIRIQDDGSVKIMDFGIARITESDTRLTKTGFSVGTAAYLAPEQIEGEVAGPASDIFAYGLVAYELLTFHRAFKGPTVSAMMYQILHLEPDPVSTLQPRCPPRLEDVVSRCLAKELTERYRSFDEVRADLLEVAADLGVPVEETGVLQSHRHRRTASARDSRVDLTQPTRTMVTPKSGDVSAEDSQVKSGAPTGEVSPSAGRSKGLVAALIAIVLVAGFFAWRWMDDRNSNSPRVEPETTLETSALEAPAEEVLPTSEDVRLGSETTGEQPVAVASTTEDPPTVAPTSTRDEVGELLKEAEASSLQALRDAEASGARQLATDAFGRGQRQRARALELRAEDPRGAIHAFWESRELFGEARLVAQRKEGERRTQLATEEAAKAAAEAARIQALETAKKAESVPAVVATQPPEEPTKAAESIPKPPPAVINPEGAIEAALKRYELAYEQRSEEGLLEIWPSIDKGRLDNIGRAFSQYRTLDLTISRCDIEFVGNSRATARCQVRQVADLVGGQHVDNETETLFRLAQASDGSWLIEGL
ncbi:MAG: protein kinase [Thermoanaerobaculia bacterium]|nr:protein kinase [Thermoanaerobaculia bacterium]